MSKHHSLSFALQKGHIFVRFVAFVGLVWIVYREATRHQLPVWLDDYSRFSTLGVKPRRILVREGGGYHEEVSTSFLASLSRSRRTRSTISLRKPRFDMESINDQIRWLHPPSKLGGMTLDPSEVARLDPHVVIAITCGDDLKERSSTYDDIFEQTRAILYCVVHHAERFKGKSPWARQTRKWIIARRIRFIALSDHVLQTLKPHIGNAPAVTYPPIFDAGAKRVDDDQKQPYFAMQGNIDTKRRSYKEVFSSLQKHSKETFMSNNIHSHLYVLGRGSLENVPQEIKGMIHIERALKYLDFYNVLANSIAIIPAFASYDYFVNKASSSVPASIISGTPLVVTQELLDSYTYLDKSAVILRKNQESELDAAYRFASLPPLRKSRIAANLLALRQRILRRNRRLLDGWIIFDTSTMAY